MRIIICSILVLMTQTLFAQYSESLISDRPGQSLSPNTVGKNIFQIQAGYNYDEAEQTTRTFYLPTSHHSQTVNNNANAKVRFGILERFEASAQASFGRIETTYKGEDFIELDNGIQLLGIAVRGNMLTTKGGKFSLGTEFETRFVPDGDDELDYSDMLFTFAGALAISNKLSATGNFGLYIDSETDGFLTANLAYAAFEKLGVFAEFYPIIDNLDFIQSYLNTGLYYSISDSFMLDLAGSFLVSDYQRDDKNEVSQYVIQFGVTGRFGKNKRSIYSAT